MRALRRELGLSQAQVAQASGLSRQSVSAVESGRNAPSVDAALALARALGTSVEELFTEGPAGRAWEPVLGTVPDGTVPIVTARVGERPVFAPLPHRGASEEGWRAPDALWRDGSVEAFETLPLDGLVVAGCDPVLGLAARLLPPRGPHRLVSIAATSVAAARALHRDRVHAALVHGTSDRLKTPTPRAFGRRIARWRVGVAARDEGSLALEPIASGHLRIAHRPLGAEAERALQRALKRAGGTAAALVGPLASGHLDAARLAAEGSVDVALTMEPAANAYGLAFRSLEDHTVELRVAERWAEHPGVEALFEVLGSARLAARLQHLGGYQLAER